jgi:transposase-like protein
MYVKLNGDLMYLWLAVDQEGEIPEGSVDPDAQPLKA